MSAVKNKINSLQLVYTKPTALYIGNNQASIEALTGIEIGSEAYALAEDTKGVLKSTGWEWGSGGGGGTWGTITGELQDQKDLDVVLARIETLQNKRYTKIKKSSVASKVFSNSNFI